jgi:hypothetical protein
MARFTQKNFEIKKSSPRSHQLWHGVPALNRRAAKSQSRRGLNAEPNRSVQLRLATEAACRQLRTSEFISPQLSAYGVQQCGIRSYAAA